MPLTEHTAVVRRLVVSTKGAPAGEAGRGEPVTATAAAVSAVLRAFGRSPEDLPARTAVFVGAARTAAGLGAEHEGFPVHTASSPGRALRRAHRELLAKNVDLALVAGFGEPRAEAVTVHAVRRAAEAVADGDSVLGVPDFSGEAPAFPAAPGTVGDAPVIHPLRYGGRGTDPGGVRLLLWSGRDEADEARVRGELRPMVDRLSPEAFPLLPAAVPRGQEPGPVRAAAVTTAQRAARAVLGAGAVTTGRPRPVALLFPGQGSQHTAMAAGLYGREPVFTAAMDAVLDLFGEDHEDIRADWLADGATRTPKIGIDDVRRAQPLLFAVDYALGRTVLGWGVRPTAFLGHSAGELVAAVFTGVVSLPDAVGMMRERVRYAVEIPPGGMLAVGASEEELRPYLCGDVAIAAVNAGRQTMLAGSREPLGEVEAALRADGHTVVAVPATSPFHCPAMAPASEAVERAYRGVRLRPPALPLYSGYTGGPLSPDDALRPDFWARQLTDTVYFRPALDELLAADDMLLIEAGPRQTLTAFARRHQAVRLKASAVVPMLPARPGGPEEDRRSVLTAAARLWEEGHVLKPDAVSRLWNWSAGAPLAPPVPEAPGVPVAPEEARAGAPAADGRFGERRPLTAV
ncbi:acyltransferase domain-containing protein [Streptomyces sp. CNQ085]|uniref:acyltransferase domain-containing protein n=1 Tax=Streptomyces sp. CNQ085 TaxID=2886944 RepID=UPI001F50ED50|nr:acyltransferase domain-containing protein [Streptomyces sp. CNQ085]MCI0383405.1 acyltransferase domain-containing protein [Streptomyces sp. CNQ085]